METFALDDASVSCVLEMVSSFDLLIAMCVSKLWRDVSKYVFEKNYISKRVCFDALIDSGLEEEEYVSNSVLLLSYMERLAPHKATFLSMVDKTHLGSFILERLFPRHHVPKVESGEIYIAKTPTSIRIMKYLISWVYPSVTRHMRSKPHRWNSYKDDSIYTTKEYDGFEKVSNVEINRFLECENCCSFKSNYVIKKVEKKFAKSRLGENVHEKECQRVPLDETILHTLIPHFP